MPSYTVVEFLREVGALSVGARDRNNKMLFVRHAYREEGKSLLKKVVKMDLTKKKSLLAK